MKKLAIWIFLFAFVFLLSGCNELENFLTTTQPLSTTIGTTDGNTTSFQLPNDSSTTTSGSSSTSATTNDTTTQDQTTTTDTTTTQTEQTTTQSETTTTDMTTTGQTTTTTQTEQTTTTENQQLLLFEQILNAYDYTASNGFNYSVNQYVDDIKTNSRQISQRIEWAETPIISTRIIETNLLSFNPDNDTETITTDTYYQNNQIGEYDAEGQLVWSDMPLDDYADVKQPVLGFDTAYFDTWEIITPESTSDELILRGTVDLDDLDLIFGFDDEAITYVELEIKIDETSETLISITVSYTQTLSEIVMNFVPYYGDVDVTIPQ